MGTLELDVVEVVERIEVVLATDDVAEIVVFCTKADVDIDEVVDGRSLVDVEDCGWKGSRKLVSECQKSYITPRTDEEH